MRTTFVFDRATGELVPKEARETVPTLQVMPDIPPYQSPVTGQWIDGRVARREDLKRTGCREVDPSERPKGGE